MARLPRDEWERRFLAGLAEEWEVARWGLPREHAQALRAPVFAVSDSESQWGCWHGAPRRELRLSWRLLWNHPWYAVVDVLRHEMAHQVAEEVLHGAGEPPHGAKFRQACHWLAVVPRTRTDYPTLDQIVAGEGELADGDRILVRVRKLLALAESPNRHEAELALAKARELMERHNIDLLEHGARREFLTIRVGEVKKRHSRDEQFMSSLLGEFYLVRVVWVPGYDPENDRSGTVLEISGTPLNVRLAHYVFDYVREFCRREWILFSWRRRLGPNARRDFTLGILSGFAETLRREHVPETAAVRALVQRGDAELDEYCAVRYPRLVTRRRDPARCRADLLDKGRQVGRDLAIHPGIEAPSGPKRLGQ